MGNGHARASGLLDDQSGPEQALPSDALSAVLRAVSLTGTCFFVVEATGPWWAEVPCAAAIGSCILPGAQQLVSYHVVTEGRCWAGLEHGASLWAEAGDIVVIPHGDCYALASAPGVVGEQPVDDSKAFFRGLTAGLLPPTIRYGDSGPPNLRVLWAFWDAAFCRSILYSGCYRRWLASRDARTWLPPPGAPGDLALSESRERSAGSDVVLLRISELLFVEVIRRHVDALPPDQTGWLAGLRDPVVSQALALLHRDPARAWSLHSLAREVAVSRSVLAERFTRLVGQAPIQYLTRWRMQLAARGLLEGKPVARVGLDVGYESEATFSGRSRTSSDVAGRLAASPPGALGSTGELARLGVHLHAVAFLHEQRDPHFHAGLERRGLGHAAAAGVAADRRLGVGDGRASTCGGSSMPIGLPLSFRISTGRLSTRNWQSPPSVSAVRVTVS